MSSFHIPPEHPLAHDIQDFLIEKKNSAMSGKFGINISERTEIGFGTIYAITPQNNTKEQTRIALEALAKNHPTIYKMLLETSFAGTEDIKIYVLRNIQEKMIWQPQKTNHQKIQTAKQLEIWMTTQQ